MFKVFIQYAERQDPLVQFEFEEIKAEIKFDSEGTVHEVLL